MKLRALRLDIAIWIVLAVAAVGLAGCGGSDDNDYYNYSGTVYGIKVTPLDGTTGIDVGEDVYVSWPESGYPEPASFTFKMEEETSTGGWAGVYTQNVGSTYTSGVEVWRFRPVDYLSYYTWFRVTITDDTNRKQVIMFRSQASSAFTASKTPAGGTDAKGAVVHTIQTKK